MRLLPTKAPALLLAAAPMCTKSFTAHRISPRTASVPAHRTGSCALEASSSLPTDYDEARLAASALLYADLQNARARAAEREGELLADRITDFEAPYETTLEGAAESPLPKIKRPKVAAKRGGGGGFGGGGGSKEKKAKRAPAAKKKKYKKATDMTAKEKQTLQQAAALIRDGCLRIDGALKKETAARVKACILREIENAREAKEREPEKTDEINARHGIDQERENRCVINLPLRADKIEGYAKACKEADSTFEEGISNDPIIDALNELLDPVDGALGPLYAELCGEEAPLYEICSLVTWPGSLRQSVHPDAAHQLNPPLFAAFVACQDITPEMGPTLFLPGTQLPTPERAKFDEMETRNDMIADFPAPKAATLKAGDLAIFDMRCLHVGQANHPEYGASRVLFNLTFRNPAADQPIGYDGSIRNHYFEKFNLAGLQAELERGRKKGDEFVDAA